jgi:hypothetical protein
MTKTEIVAEPGVPQVVVTREFAASPRVLFRAHTEPDLISQWLGPEFLETTVDVLEPRDGGRWRYTYTDRDGVRAAAGPCCGRTPSSSPSRTGTGMCGAGWNAASTPR